MKKWVTIFPYSKNVHLIKDVGYIPYMMNKMYDYDASIVSYNMDNYQYLESYLKGLKIEFLSNKIKNDKIATIIYIIRNARSIDVLSLFHLKPKNLIYFYLYKRLNKNGKTYLKLDANENIKNVDLNSKSIKPMIYKRFLKYCDLISVETTELHRWLNDNWDHNVEYVPNGFWKDVGETDYKITKVFKKNYITTVGRLGSKYKDTYVLVEAYLKVYKDIPEWNLCLVGSMTEEFNKYLLDTINKNPDIKERIILKGFIEDLKELDYIYKESKIFCLTSNSESFGLVYVEALKNGCYILTSNVLAAKDVTGAEKYGKIFEIGNINQLSNVMKMSCNEYNQKVKSCEIINFAYNNFDWEVICDKIRRGLNLEG